MLRLLLVAVLTLVPCWVLAQEATSTPVQEKEGFSPKHFVGDITHGIYDSSVQKWNWPAVGVIGATGVSSYFLYRWADPELNNPTDSRKMGSAGRVLSDIGEFGPYAIPAGFLSVGLLRQKTNPERDRLFRTAEQLAEALVFTAGTTYLLKYTVSRERPDLSNDHSFPSGHASLSFATAGVLAYRYPWYVGVTSLAVASAIGFARVDLNKHYASDIAAGAGIGLFFASAVHYYHLRFETHAPAKNSFFVPPLLPLMTRESYGLTWSTVF